MSQGLIFEETLACEPVCNVCNCIIDDAVHRIIIFQDDEKTPIVRRFHFFFPCWDIDEICKNEMGYKIANAGLSCEKTSFDDPVKLRCLQRNSSLWE